MIVDMINDVKQLVIGEAPQEVPGVSELTAWYGYFPYFHDAEVISVTLNRSGPLTVKVHQFEMTDKVDAEGYYVLTKHAIVTFILDEVEDSRFEGFNRQNVLNAIYLRRILDEYQLILDGCYGLDAVINCKQVKIEFIAGVPTDPPLFKRSWERGQAQP